MQYNVRETYTKYHQDICPDGYTPKDRQMTRHYRTRQFFCLSADFVEVAITALVVLGTKDRDYAKRLLEKDEQIADIKQQQAEGDGFSFRLFTNNGEYQYEITPVN